MLFLRATIGAFLSAILSEMTDPAQLISRGAYAHRTDLQVRFAPLTICSEATCKSLICATASIRGGCCLYRYTGDWTTPIPDSPSAVRPDGHASANHSLSVWPEHLSVPPNSVLRLRVASASTTELPRCARPQPTALTGTCPEGHLARLWKCGSRPTMWI